MPSTTATDGSTIEYEVHGDGPTLLLVPGLGFGPWGFFKQVPALSRRFRTVTFDLRAPRDRDHGVTELARDAAALLDRLGTGRAHVLGTSDTRPWARRNPAPDWPEAGSSVPLRV